MFLEFHASSYQQYHTWNEDDIHYPRDTYFLYRRRGDSKNNATNRLAKHLHSIQSGLNPGAQYKFSKTKPRKEHGDKVTNLHIVAT